VVNEYPFCNIRLTVFINFVGPFGGLIDPFNGPFHNLKKGRGVQKNTLRTIGGIFSSWASFETLALFPLVPCVFQGRCSLSFNPQK